MPEPYDDLLGPELTDETPLVEVELTPTTDTDPDEPAIPLRPLPPLVIEPLIVSAPTERETISPQPFDSVLGPVPKNLGPWRAQWEALQSRNAFPDKTDRRDYSR
jgi:hypothetical protein